MTKIITGSVAHGSEREIMRIQYHSSHLLPGSLIKPSHFSHYRQLYWQLLEGGTVGLSIPKDRSEQSDRIYVPNQVDYS
jgi:hypothetical protein